MTEGSFSIYRLIVIIQRNIINSWNHKVVNKFKNYIQESKTRFPLNVNKIQGRPIGGIIEILKPSTSIKALFIELPFKCSSLKKFQKQKKLIYVFFLAAIHAINLTLPTWSTQNLKLSFYNLLILTIWKIQNLRVGTSKQEHNPYICIKYFFGKDLLNLYFEFKFLFVFN